MAALVPLAARFSAHESLRSGKTRFVPGGDLKVPYLPVFAGQGCFMRNTACSYLADQPQGPSLLDLISKWPEGQRKDRRLGHDRSMLGGE